MLTYRALVVVVGERIATMQHKSKRMHQNFRVGRYTVYGGMQLRDNPCAVFVDNPLFSEMIFRNAVNPTGGKTWQRFVRQTGQANCCFVPEQQGTGQDYDRLNSYFRRKSGQDFDHVWGGWRPVESRPDLPWLVCEPRDEILRYWYGTTLSEWRTQIQDALGAEPYHVRPKPIRRERSNGTVPRVIHMMAEYRGVITAHSVSAIDAILAGRPAVIWGQDPTLGCGTPFQHWEADHAVRIPSLDQVQTAACTWAATTYSSLDTERAVECVMR
jgi:hypothetical protein